MKKLTPIISVFSSLFIWEALVWFKFVDGSFFPAPHSFIKHSILLILDSSFRNDLFQSLLRLVIASLLSIPLATMVAFLTARIDLLNQWVSPLIALTYPLPKAALFPLMLLLFGLGNGAKIFLIGIGMFYLVYLNVHHSLQKLLTSKLMDVVKLYQLSPFHFYYHFLFKGIFRDFLIGVKAALGYGLVLVVVSEFNISRDGIGRFIWQSWDQFRIVEMYSGLLILTIIGFVFSYVSDFFIYRTKGQ